jgi:hypothetical protein
MKRSYNTANVQRDVVRLRETSAEMLCLYAPHSPTRRMYRAVLEITPINFLLKAEEEQEALIERFRALITSLTFPVQLLIRNQRLDLTPYIQRLREGLESQETAPRSPVWHDLIASQIALLQQLAARRTLIERHCYLVLPASLQPTRSGAGRTGRFALPGFPGRKRHAQLVTETQKRARHELALHAETLIQQFASCGLRCHRLNNQELAQLYYGCLTPERSLVHPLTDAFLAGVGRPKTVRTREGKRKRYDTAEDEQQQTLSDVLKQEEASALAAAAEQTVAILQAIAADTDLPPPPLPDLTHLVDLLAPESIQVTPDTLQIGKEYACGIAVTDYPREVSFAGWLAPLFLHDEIVDITFHFHPQDAATMKRQLQRNRAGHVSGRRFNAQQGRADDPDALVAEEDINRLLGDLARNTERMLDLGFYMLVRAASQQSLEARTERIFSVLSLLSLGVAAHPTTFEQLEAWRACLPEAHDALMRTCTLDATTLATMFPFLSNSLSMPDGVLMGVTETHEPVLLNPWDSSLENPHMFIGGVTGAGKSYLGKLLVARDLFLHARRGDQFFVIDPDLEYASLAEALGGTVIRMAPGSAQHLNPFDLLPPRCELTTYQREARKGDRLAEKIQDLHAMLDIMLADELTTQPSGSGTLSKREKGLLDQALYETYRKVGITADPRTHDRQPPLLRDLYDVLKSATCGPDETDLAGRLYRYVFGSLASLFAEATSVDLSNQLVVWDIRDMRNELRPLAISLIAERVWTQALYQSHLPRSLYIDEAASLIEHPEGGRFLATLSRRARKRYLRIVTMTQNPEQFVQDPWGSVVAANAAIKVLKTQDATSAAAVAERFQLTKGEQQRLMTFGKHEALVLAGDRRVIMTIEASPREHDLITTNPVEQAEQAEPDRVAQAQWDAEASVRTASRNQVRETPLAPFHLPPEPLQTSNASASNGQYETPSKKGHSPKQPSG